MGSLKINTIIQIAIIIPCFNEEAAIAQVINDYKNALPQAKIYVFDNNSTDATAQIAAGNHPIKVICKIKQITPCIIFPLKMNDNQGRSTANMIIVLYLSN